MDIFFNIFNTFILDADKIYYKNVNYLKFDFIEFLDEILSKINKR